MAGGSGAGKTTLVESVAARLGDRATVLWFDEYYHDLAHMDPSERVDWDLYMDTETGVITSETGELVWDTTAAVVTIDTSSTQGVVGWAGGSSYSLGDYTLTVTTDFVSLLLTALDGEPLATSGKVLVTAMARDIQLGAEYSDDGSELVEVGGPPLLLEPVRATIMATTGVVESVTPLNPYGVPVDDTVTLAEDGSFTIDGRYRSAHYLVELQVEEQDGDTASADGESGKNGGKGCGCSSFASRSGLGAWAGLLVLLGFAGLRRRNALR
ncbi:MAG: hypothetical protein QGG40_02450 [Myxococcota bacterium]|nr:hypothetical protein [Myxococcota bacterium]